MISRFEREWSTPKKIELKKPLSILPLNNSKNLKINIQNRSQD